jgi:tripartite-type tricarboxylate transporter receptor subunit TctC
MFHRRALVTLFALLLTVGGAQAQSWPDRPIRFIVTLGAGSTPDILARLVAAKLSPMFGQQVIVENRVGGSNAIGMAAGARARPDGYTFVFATAAALVTNPHTFKSLPYDAEHDFTSVGFVARAPFFVLVHPSVKAATLAELIDIEKKKPGSIVVATDGPRNFSGMLTAWLGKLGGVDFSQVPYPSMPQGVQDAVAGRVQAIILATASAAPMIAGGKLKPLAVSSAAKVQGFEQVPSVAATFPGFDFSGWFVLIAPAKTPDAIVQRVNLALNNVLKDPDVTRLMSKAGFITDGAGTPATTAAFVHSEYEAWGKVIKEIGLQKE